MESTKITSPAARLSVGKPAKLGRAIKTAIPLLAMLGGGALASTRNTSSSVNGRKLKSAATVYVNKLGHEPVKEQVNTNKTRRSAFAAFSRTDRVKKTVNARHEVDHGALDFLKNNGLLQQGNATQASLSGNTLGRKTFADFCAATAKNTGDALSTGDANVVAYQPTVGACTGAGHVWHYTVGGQCTTGAYTVRQCVADGVVRGNVPSLTTHGTASWTNFTVNSTKVAPVGDTTPPTFENGTPSIGSETGTGATVSADLDEDGTVYYVVVADGAAAPSVSEVKAGTGSGGSGQLAAGNFTTTGTTGNEAFGGLSDNTAYDLYVVAEDDEGTPNVQASVTKVDFATLDTTAPTITAVSIPDSDHKVGDTVTATITVASDTDDYTTGSGGISGTIAGYALGSLSKTNDTTYTATFTITDGGTDVAAGSNIAVNFTLDDSSGNTSSAYTTAISQASDAIYANLPDVDLTADTNTIAEDGGVSTLTATLSGSLNNQWPSAITVNLAYSGTGTAGTDYTKSDSIVISAGNSSNTATVTGTADTLFDAASDETAIVDISSLSVGNEGTTNQQTITITDAESAPTVDLSVGNASVNENGGTSTITATLSHQTYDSTVVNLSYGGTAVGGGTDYNSPSASITINANSLSANAATGIIAVDDGSSDGNQTIIIDISSVTGSASENGTQQQTVTIIDDEDGVAPTITGITIPDSAHKNGDIVTATISVTSDADDYTTGSGAIAGNINGFTLGSLSKSNDTTYTATFTVAAGSDIAAGSDVPVNLLTLTDSSGNTSSVYSTPISQASDAIYANLPDVDLTADTNTIAEDGGVSTLTATLSGSLNNQWPADITVNLAYTGTGTAATDYAKSDSITITSGNSTGTATVTATADTIFDAAANETAIVDIDSLSAGNEGTTNQQTITITDAEVAPVVTLSTGAAVVAENGGTSAITATLNNPTYADVTVNLGYTGTATSGGIDYNTPSSVITITAGNSSANAATGITGVDDGDSEGFETIIIDVASVTGGSATESGSQQETVTINDDETIPVVTLSAGINTLAEDGGTATLTATLDQVTFEDVTVNLAYSGTATGGSDYASPASSITISAGQLTGTSTLTATNDSTDEDDETIIVDISSVSGGNSIESGSQSETLTIIDDDSTVTPNPDPDPEPETALVSLAASPSSIAENGGTSTISVSLDQAISESVTVALAYSGSASSGSDYQTPAGSVTIAAGETSADLSLTAIADSEQEDNESIIVAISGVSGSIASEDGDQVQTVTITDATSVITTAADSAAVDEDASVDINVLANDSISGGSFDIGSVTVSSSAQHGVTEINNESGMITYRPDADFNGSDSFSYTVSDLSGNQSEATLVTINVAAINDAPLAQDDMVVREDWQPLTLDVLANDSDVDGDELKIIGAVVDIGAVSFTDSDITFTPAGGFAGSVFIDYVVSDGTEEASARVQIDMQASDENLPVITLPEDIEVNADALHTKVDLGVAEAVDSSGNSIPVSLEDGITFFKPGTNTVFWTATDSEGRSATASQVVKVNPLISLDKDQTVTEGAEVRVGIRLNGESPQYPLSVPYSVSGSAQFGVDHDLDSGTVTINSGTDGVITFNILNDAISEGDETLVIELDSGLNRGSKFSQQLTITEDNVPPKVSLKAEQGGEERFVINQQDGLVVITSEISHPDAVNQYTYAWSNKQQLLNDSDSSDTSFSFDPSGLAAGVYHVALTVTDSDDITYSGHDQLTLRLDATSIALGTQDSDNDGIADDVEGLDDGDNDGIPDYLDNIDECNVVPEQVGTTDNFLVEGDPGVCLRLGDTALTGASGGTRLLEDDVNDEEVVNVGGIFDFIAYGLPIEGQEYRVVLPQVQPIPANAVYRKQKSSGEWTNFVQDSGNQLWSTEGESGFCPPPGDEQWQPGLTEGHWCVQLVMTDGGANDADGIANGTIVDPGGVAVMLDNNQQPQAENDSVQTLQNTPLTIDVLANDSDGDGDSLEITSANAVFGTVTIENNQLYYQPPSSYFGEDTLVYGISDNQGGSASATLTITILANESPVAVNDAVTLLSGKSQTLNVLDNDSDAEGSELALISATAELGSVSINDDGTLSYQAPASYVGTDTVTYVIRDSMGAEAEGTVTVTLVESREYTSAQGRKRNGGSAFYLVLIALVGLVGRRKLTGR
ncbi:Ig-like domain-containing protein [Thalassomonas sp. RHCl1]|uniref:Ig-like domain-containing protein n=1 Tax=Thalassomonas sp. RHCl1 TaxID=2995320 RepID=UPI00248BAA04|nr:Ig-like domain-containing protein [Thalassomonas sp. RHCl1]